MNLMQFIVDAGKSENLVTDKLAMLMDPHTQSVLYEHFAYELACLLMSCMSLWLISHLELDISGWV
jgi:hypothetical protein